MGNTKISLWTIFIRTVSTWPFSTSQPFQWWFVFSTVILTLTTLRVCVWRKQLPCSIQRLIFYPCGERANTIPSFIYEDKQTSNIQLCYFAPPSGKALLDFTQLNLKTDSGSVCFDHSWNMFFLTGWPAWSATNTWFEHFAQKQKWRLGAILSSCGRLSTVNEWSSSPIRPIVLIGYLCMFLKLSYQHF